MFHNVLRVFHDVLRVFHDVLRVFHDVLRVVHDVPQCFTCVSWCFTMFNDVLLCLASRATIDAAASATADHLRDRDNVTMAPQGSSISPRM